MSTEDSNRPFEGSGHVNPYDQFLLFGDSITQQAASQEAGFAFAPALQDAYVRKLDVINRGFSGYTTAHGIKVLPHFMPKTRQALVRFMTIFFGANDACLPGTFQHVPLDEYRENLKTLITHPAVTAHSPRILLLTPPPINEYQTDAMDLQKGLTAPQRSAENTKCYADCCREVGESLKVPVVDIWTAFMKAAGWQEGQPLIGSRRTEPSKVLEKLLSDGLHFKPDGYRIMYNEVMKTIRETWPDQSPENLPMIYPPWEQAPR